LDLDYYLRKTLEAARAHRVVRTTRLLDDNF